MCIRDRCEYADRKTKIIKTPQAVKKRICKRVEEIKIDKKKLSAYINNGNMTGESCRKGWGEPLSTQHHKRKRERGHKFFRCQRPTAG